MRLSRLGEEMVFYGFTNRACMRISDGPHGASLEVAASGRAGDSLTAPRAQITEKGAIAATGFGGKKWRPRK